MFTMIVVIFYTFFIYKGNLIMGNRLTPETNKKKTKTKPEQTLRFGMHVSASGTGLDFLCSYRMALINQLMITESEIVKLKLQKQKMEEM